MSESTDITALLNAWGDGDKAAGDALAPLVYDELRRIADRLFRSETPGHVLQPTALVNEAFAKLIDADISWNDRAHFFAVAARMMRRLLINHAKASAAVKRGGDALRVTFDESQLPANAGDIQLIRLTDALEDLEKLNARKAKLIELFYFGGLTVDEIQSVTDLSPATIGRDLRFARAWLFDHLSTDSD